MRQPSDTDKRWMFHQRVERRRFRGLGGVYRLMNRRGRPESIGRSPESARGRIRTCGLPLRRRLLYPLSYAGGQEPGTGIEPVTTSLQEKRSTD